MTEADLSRVLPEELARQTLALPNAEAWRVMGARLATAGTRRAGQVREAAWAIRRELQAARERAGDEV